MNIFYAQFTTGQTVAAAGITNAALQSWIKRDLIVGHRSNPISGGGTPGVHRRYSFFNVMEIAVAKALTDVGVPDLETAFHAASHFAHVGGGPLGPSPERCPGLPFENRDGGNLTLLAVAGMVSKEIAYKPGTDFFASLRHSLRNPGGMILLEIDPIFERVADILGYDCRDVMAIAYPKASN